MNHMPIMHGPPGTEVDVDGRRYLYFGGTSYLGLAAHAEVIEAGCQALREFGVHSATTRAGFGTNPPVFAVEKRVAEFFETEDAFYFSSGYVAAQVATAGLAVGTEGVLLEESAHYSAHEAARLCGLPVTPFRARDPESLGLAARKYRRVMVLADAVSPATGVVAPVLDYIAVLEQVEQAFLVLDDAHGLGVLGPHGRGLLDQLNLWPKANRLGANQGVHLTVCGTASKAFGGFGGVLPGTADFIRDRRRASHHFDGASAPPSGAAGATAKAIEIAGREPWRRERLRENSQRLRRGLRWLGLAVPEGETAHLGVSIGAAANMRRLHLALKERGILLPYLGAYSGTPSEGVLRFAVFADHTAPQIDRLLDELKRVL